MTKRDLIFFKILEISWLVIFFSGLTTCINIYIHDGFSKDCIMFAGMSIVAIGMFFYRRNKRKQLMQK